MRRRSERRGPPPILSCHLCCLNELAIATVLTNGICCLNNYIVAGVAYREPKLSKMPLIAVVDDDESFRRAMTSFIRSLGCTVLQFASAEEFLKSSRLHDTDCAVSDVQMPAMNGIELQEQLIAQGHRFPIIFVTAFPEMKARARALAASIRHW